MLNALSLLRLRLGGRIDTGYRHRSLEGAAYLLHPSSSARPQVDEAIGTPEKITMVSSAAFALLMSFPEPRDCYCLPSWYTKGLVVTIEQNDMTSWRKSIHALSCTSLGGCEA
jgi:hypothetical protein